MSDSMWERRKRAFRNPVVQVVVALGIVVALVGVVQALRAQQELSDGQHQARAFAEQYVHRNIANDPAGVDAGSDAEPPAP
jgi:hypothetical protein